MNFILNVFDVFISADPNWSGSDVWNIFLINFVFFIWSQNIEFVTSLLCWLLVVNNFVEVIVNNFSKIDDGSFLNLNFAFGVELDSGVVNEAHISEIELSINRTNHKLCFPKLLVIWNMEVRGLTFANFVNGSVSFNFDFNILQLFGVDLLKLKSETLFWNVFRFDLHKFSSEITLSICFNLFQFKCSEGRLNITEVAEIWRSGVRVVTSKSFWISITCFIEISVVKFELVSKSVNS